MVAGGRPSVWLAGPSRFAAVDRPTARLWLIGVVTMLLAAAMFAHPAPAPVDTMFEAVVTAMRHGGGYYETLAALVRSDPQAGAERLATPALPAVAAAIPGWVLTALVTTALSALLWLGTSRLARAFDRTAGAIVLAVMTIAGTIAAALLIVDAPGAGLATILLTAALLLRQANRWGTAAALACAAGVIDPAALPLILALGLLTLIDGSAHELAGWGAAALVGAVVFGCHLYALARWGIGIDGSGGEPRVAAPLVAGALPGVPVWLAAPAVLLSAFGWASWPDALGLRIAVLMGIGAAGTTLAGLHSAALLTIFVAPGLAFAPDALADLWRIAVDRRRITVTRIVR